MAGLLLVLVALVCGVAAQAAFALPSIEEVTPVEGPAAGGTEVTIYGSGFTAVTSVSFGTTNAIKYTVESSVEIVAEAPTHADGVVDIVVKTSGGESSKSSADHYTFTGALPKAPVNVTLPTITPEKPVENAVESASTGTWTNLPNAYKYQWLHCLKTCEEVKGATSSTFYPSYKYLGETLEVAVKAENAGGVTQATSLPTKAVASNGVVEYHTGLSRLKGIASGPEEHLWFTAATGGLGLMTTAGGVLKEYTVSESFPEAIAEGSDHNLWFTEWGKSKIGKITPTGTITEYALPAGREPYDIVKGPDGNMWFTEQGQGTSWGKIGKITTAGVITEYALPEEASWPVPVDITSGPEESLWFTLEYLKTTGTDKVDKITTAGKLTEYAPPKCTPGELGGITATGGNLWFIEVACDKVVKMTTAGVFTEYKAGPDYPRDMTTGPEGNLWYTSWWDGNSHVTKMSTAGAISTEYALPPNSDPAGITVGPNKNMWVAAGSEVATIEP
jgi:virginiamycin B lyase